MKVICKISPSIRGPKEGDILEVISEEQNNFELLNYYFCKFEEDFFVLFFDEAEVYEE